MARSHGKTARRDKESRFVTSAAERDQIARAAEYRRLAPATYMRKVVLDQVDRDLADASAAAAPARPALSAAEERRQFADRLAISLGELAELAKKLGA